MYFPGPQGTWERDHTRAPSGSDRPHPGATLFSYSHLGTTTRSRRWFRVKSAKCGKLISWWCRHGVTAAVTSRVDGRLRRRLTRRFRACRIRPAAMRCPPTPPSFARSVVASTPGH